MSTTTNIVYPTRFATEEGAKKALYQGDFSDQVLPFKVVEGVITVRKEYEDARYELQYITRESGIRPT